MSSRHPDRLHENAGSSTPFRVHLEPIQVSIHDEELATRRFSMMRIMARWIKAATVLASARIPRCEVMCGSMFGRPALFPFPVSPADGAAATK